MKTHFKDYAQDIWNQVMGKKGLGISSARAENLVLILEREIGLKPVMMRVDDTLHLYTTEGFKKTNITTRLDGSVTIFYLPQDCEEATGSQAQNWTQWSSNLLGYKRQSHKMALRVRPPVGVLDVLAKRGITKGRRRLDFRFLSLELVIFYIAAQTRTWKDGPRINTVKDFIEKHDIQTRGYTPAQEEIDVDNLFPNDGAQPPPPVKPSGIPKDGHGLISYNPHNTSNGGTRVDPVEVLLNDITGPPTPKEDLLGKKDEVEADEDSLDHEIEEAKRKLAELVYKRRTRKFNAEAMKGKVIGGEPWPDRGHWAVLTIEYPDGTKSTYMDTKIVKAGIGDPVKMLEEALNKAMGILITETARTP